MGFSERLKKVQSLPLIKRKIIFWLIIIIFGSILFFLWIRDVRQKIKAFSKEKFLEETNLPKLQEELKNLPKPEVPKFEIEENLKKLEELKEKTE